MSELKAMAKRNIPVAVSSVLFNQIILFPAIFLGTNKF
jgi:hypothetical protein